jgi:hypothetical protein
MVQMNNIKKILLLLVGLIFYFTGNASVTFQFAANSIDASALKTRMENNISALLSEINRAGVNGAPLNLSSISMEPCAKERLIALWDDSHFVCDKITNVSKCLHDFQGYQVRAIPITMKPQDSSYDQSLNRELTISLNKHGVITGVRPAWELNEDVNKILATTGTGGVMETRMRRELLKWVEDFRCYYNERNISALEKIYSENALIITGSVVTQKRNAGDGVVRYDQKVNYKVQDKATYLTNLKRQFATKKYIKVEFDHISVMKHGAKANIYGVTLHQTWSTNTYHDEGWLFLLWDFNDPEKPQIHVRTWQPDQVVAKDGVFTLDDFFIP